MQFIILFRLNLYLSKMEEDDMMMGKKKKEEEEDTGPNGCMVCLEYTWKGIYVRNFTCNINLLYRPSIM